MMPAGTAEEHIFRSPEFRGVIRHAVEFFKNTPVCDLPPEFDFTGPGVYALYYRGDFPQYARFVEWNRENYDYPIYVGKAVPPGWRTNRVQGTNDPVLKRRLGEHFRTIDQCNNLNIDDFKCRFTIMNRVESDLIGALEADLIRHYSPLWNSCIDGFGDHDPGNKRHGGKFTEWDTLHPGRSWATKMTGERRDLTTVQQKVTNYLSQLQLP